MRKSTLTTGTRLSALLVLSSFPVFVSAEPQALQIPDLVASAVIQGSVFDEGGGTVAKAAVTLTKVDTAEKHTTESDSVGNYSFLALPPGTFTLLISAQGFSPFTNQRIALASNQSLQLPDITLHLAAVSSNTDVSASKEEVAEAQMKSEVKQRLLGFLPNYYVVYFKDPAPLNAAQKMRLAFRLSVDPVTFGMAAVQAAKETNSKDYAAYGTGAEGFAKRYAAAYADGFVGTMVGSGLLHAALRQDPRYYYKGTGSVRARILYALSWSFRCKGDNGQWQVAYSSLLGDIASSGISGLYNPAGINASQTVKYTMLNLASQGVNALLQEFLFKRLTTHTNEPGKSREAGSN
ncbi:MAG: carboxypeptidase-like regulatory domain-containing protein [Bryobacteraceae bacterium]